MSELVFKNLKLNKQLTERGYVVAGMLPQSIVSKLFTFYSENPNNFSGEFHTTHFSIDVDYKQKVQRYIIETVRVYTEALFTDYYPIFANFMVKEAGGGNPMPLHADWTYVDETKASSFAMWIPLVDTDYENGCIGVVPYSHELSDNIRGPRILQWEFPANEKLIAEMGELIPMRAGQALIYNHRTLHYSPPNNSANIRPAINISLVKKGDEVIHYAMPEGEEEILKFKVNDESFFIDYDNFQMPRKGIVTERIRQDIPLLNDKIDNFLAKRKNKSLWAILKKFIANDSF